MILVLPFYTGDRHLAQDLLAWIKELGDPPELYLVRDARAEPIDTLGLLYRELVVTDDAWDHWPESPNWMIGKVGRDIKDTPWLWIEPDALPTKPGWFQSLEAEWEKAKSRGKSFVGDYVDVEGVPLHMSGVGIYPPEVGLKAHEMLIAHEIAWDVQASEQIVPQAMFTKQIVHNWKHEPFGSQGEVDNLLAQHPEMVLFHADKSGTLLKFLRARGRVTVTRQAHNLETGDSTSPPANLPSLTGKIWSIQENASVRMASEGASIMGGRPDVLSGAPSLVQVEGARSQKVIHQHLHPIVCDIFIKTYEPDYDWIQYCLRSIDKFADGFRQTIVLAPVAPDGSDAFPFGMGMKHQPRMVWVGDQPDGYLWQQVIKLDADKYTDAPYILYMDSDTIFTSHATPKNYMESGKVIWMMTPWEKVSTPWQPLVEKFLKKPVAFEFMRRHPFITPRWLLAELRAFCEREHGVTLDSYIMSQPHREFSEFNALGAFAYEFFRDEFVWVNTEEVPPDQWPKLTVLQSWSKGGLTEEIKAKFETILSHEVQQTSDRIDASDETGQTDTKTLPRFGMQALRKQEEAMADQRPIKSKISGQMESKDSRSQKQDSETGQMREVREPNQTGRASRRLRETSGSDVAVQNVPQTLTVEDAIARLAVEAQRGWFYKKRIEKKLKEAGALPKWKRPRRR